MNKLTKQVLRYNTEGIFMDTLVSFPCPKAKSTEEQNDDDDDDDEIRYDLKDIAVNKKGLLAIFYIRENLDQDLAGEAGSGNKTAEIAVYAYSTPRKERRKERKDKERRTEGEDETDLLPGNHKSQCCTVL